VKKCLFCSPQITGSRGGNQDKEVLKQRGPDDGGPTREAREHEIGRMVCGILRLGDR